MNSLINGYPEISFCRDLSVLQPGSPQLADVGLLCFDAENIVVPVGGRDPIESYRAQIQDLRDSGTNTCMISNSTDSERIAHVARRLTTPWLHKGMLPMGDNGMASKVHPEIYWEALNKVGLGSNGNRAAMADDQLKNIIGAAQVAQFSRFFWTFPNFLLHQHPGTLAGRILEIPVGFGLIGLQKLLTGIKESGSQSTHIGGL